MELESVRVSEEVVVVPEEEAGAAVVADKLRLHSPTAFAWCNVQPAEYDNPQ